MLNYLYFTFNRNFSPGLVSIRFMKFRLGAFEFKLSCFVEFVLRKFRDSVTDDEEDMN